MHLARLNFLRAIVISTLLFSACSTKDPLPIYGEKTIVGSDTLYHEIPAFSFTNQFGEIVTSDQYEKQIYVADFFFTTCPSICPIMTNSLLKVQEEIKKNNWPVQLLSHTVDPETDSVDVLLQYGKNKGADFEMWNFVTGEKQKIYNIAAKYLVVANEDTTQEIQFVHSDKLVLIDANNRIRGLYSGTDETDVNRMIKDIQRLVKK